jgi:hypothetical protein
LNPFNWLRLDYLTDDIEVVTNKVVGTLDFSVDYVNSHAKRAVSAELIAQIMREGCEELRFDDDAVTKAK